MSRRILAVIFLAAVAARAAVGLSLEDRIYFADGRDYAAMARNILEGTGPRLNERTVANRGPGYAYYVAGVMAAFARTGEQVPLRAIRLSHALLGGLLCLVVAGIASRLFSPKAGLAAAALTALDPFLTFFSGFVLTESLFTLLLAAGFLFLLYSRDGKIIWAGIAGLTLGGAALVRPSVLAMLPLLGLAWLALNRKQPHVFACTVAMWLLAFSTVLPWGIRNHRLTGRYALSTLSAGASLYEGTYPGADGAPAMDRIEWPPEIYCMGEAEKNEFLQRRAVEFIRGNPQRIARLAPVKLARFWSIVPNFSEYRRPAFMAISAIYMIPVLAAIAAGILLAGSKLKPGAILLLPAVYFSLLHTVFVGSIRYRAPVMPLLAVFAGVTVAAAIEWLCRRRRAAAPQ